VGPGVYAEAQHPLPKRGTARQKRDFALIAVHLIRCMCCWMRLYFVRRPRITSTAPVSSANAQVAEPADISGAVVISASANPASPAIKNMIPAIFVIDLSLLRSETEASDLPLASGRVSFLFAVGDIA
jgi:hypothetical protein